MESAKNASASLYSLVLSLVQLLWLSLVQLKENAQTLPTRLHGNQIVVELDQLRLCLQEFFWAVLLFCKEYGVYKFQQCQAFAEQVKERVNVVGIRQRFEQLPQQVQQFVVSWFLLLQEYCSLKVQQGRALASQLKERSNLAEIRMQLDQLSHHASWIPFCRDYCSLKVQQGQALATQIKEHFNLADIQANLDKQREQMQQEAGMKDK